MIIIKNISKTFGNKKVLDSINLTIPQGSIVGLAGSSGSGKSTLLRSIQRFEPVDCGSIEYHQKTGFMFQDFQLFKHMTILENITYAPKILNSDEKIQEKAENLLKKLKIIDQKNLFPEQLSGGQKQRVALARTIINEPEIILFDEPTSGLDVATIDDIVDLLISIKTSNTTFIIASHDLNFLNKICDRIIVLKQGLIQLDLETNKTLNTIELIKKFY